MPSPRRLPLRWRVTVVAVVVQVLLLAGLGAFLSLRLSRDLTAGVDGALSARATQLTGAISDEGAASGGISDSSDVIVPGLAARESLTQVVSTTGAVLQSAGAGDADRPLLSAAQVSHASRGAVRVTTTLPALGRTRLLAIPAGAGRVVVVGNSLGSVDRAESRLQALIGVGGAVALLLGGGASWLLAGRALRPIDSLSAAAAAIGGDDLERRVPIPPTGDEAARLAETLNRLLERVSQAVAKERAFLADASHELRTPVTTLRAELEVALRSPSTPAPAREVLASMVDETARLSRLIDDLLALARADAGSLSLMTSSSDLAGPADRIARLLGPVAATRGVSLATELRSAPALLDPDRIAQVVLNLVDNAIRHTRPGGTITIATGVDDGCAILAVADEGTGIADDLAPRIFERFSRGDLARGRQTGGTGLGLSIALAIARAHGGSLTLDRTGSEGSRFVLRLPRSTA